MKLFRISLMLLMVFVCARPSAAAQPKDAVIKIFVTSNKMDYYRPWQSTGIRASAASGVVLSGNRILTNAHVISDHTFIQVKKHKDPKRYTARVQAIGNDCDLAIITVNDSDFFKNTTSVELGKLPQLHDSVTVLGYPQGGEKLSITEGVVSRIEVQPYSQSTRQLLSVQIDAAINPGNSGGPVLQDGKLVGIVMQSFQTAQNIGYMIPPPVIEHFFKDLEDGQYNGFPLLGINFVNTENASLRKFYQAGNEEGGVFVTKVLPFSPADGNLQEGDIILKINNTSIGEDGTFVFRNGERLGMPYLITKEQIGKKIHFKIIRGGKRKNISLELKPFTLLVPDRYHFKKPPYYIYGGLVFTVLSSDLLRAWGKGWWEKAPLDFVYYLIGTGKFNDAKKKERIVLLSVLPDDINVGYHNSGNEIVNQINGQPFSSFKEFVQLLDRVKNESNFTIITTESNEQLIIDNTNITQINKTIIDRNNIPAQYSQDVAEWLSTDE